MKRKRQRLEVTKLTDAKLKDAQLTEQEEHDLRADLQLVSARFPKGQRLPLWPVSSFGQKRVFGSVHFFHDHIDVSPMRRVLEGYAVLFGYDWSDKHSEWARAETRLSFDHRLPFDQWETRAKQLPIKTWAAFVRQEAQAQAPSHSPPCLWQTSSSWPTRRPQCQAARGAEPYTLTLLSS